MTVSDIQSRLDDLNVFMRTPVCASMLASLRVDISSCEASILATPPRNAEDTAHVMFLQGQLAQLRSDLSLFEAARTSLEDALNDAVEAEEKVRNNTQKENNE